MNMNYDWAEQTQKSGLDGDSRTLADFCEPLDDSARGRLIRWLFRSMVIGLFTYFILTGGIKTVLILAGIGLLGLGLATAVCIYALDNAQV